MANRSAYPTRSKWPVAGLGVAVGLVLGASALLSTALAVHDDPGTPFELDGNATNNAGNSLDDWQNVFDLGMPLRRLATEDLFTSFTPLLALLVGRPIDPDFVELGYPEPPHAARYAQTFNCPVRFDAPVSRFVLGGAALSMPLVSADADSAVLFERSCRELLSEIERHASLTNELRQLLLASPGKLPDAAAVAARLHIGERTLRRRLAAERTSYQQVLDEVRSRIAIDYLTTTHLSTQEIATLLGFSEATNFRRAFMRWTRRTPSSYRKGP